MGKHRSSWGTAIVLAVAVAGASAWAWYAKGALDSASAESSLPLPIASVIGTANELPSHSVTLIEGVRETGFIEDSAPSIDSDSGLYVDDEDPAIKALDAALASCSSVNPNPFRGDPVAGLWADPTRPDTGWTITYKTNPYALDVRQRDLVQLVWHTFYPQVGGGWTWLVSDPKPILESEANPNLRYVSAPLRRLRFNVPDDGIDVGWVRVEFPEDGATRASISWTWDRDHGGPSGETYGATQCIYAFQYDGAPLARGPTLNQSPVEEDFPDGAPEGPYYHGIWIDPIVPGYQIETHELTSRRLRRCVSPGDDANPHPPNCFPRSRYAEGDDANFSRGYTQFHTLSIYDDEGKPAWLVAQMGPYPDWPSPSWVEWTDPDALYQATEVGLHYRTANYSIVNECSANCSNETPLNPYAGSPQTGSYFGRNYLSRKSGVIGLKVTEAGLTWPKLWPVANPPDADMGECPHGRDVCRLVEKSTDTFSLNVDRSICDLPTPDSTCTVRVTWNGALLAQVKRLDANATAATGSEVPKPHGNDGGIVGAAPWGSVQDVLSADEQVIYRLKVGATKVRDFSVRAGYSAITVPSRCVLMPGETSCAVELSWRAPDKEEDSLLHLYRYEGPAGGPYAQRTLLCAPRQCVGRKTTDIVPKGRGVYYELRRKPIADSGNIWLASTSSNPTLAGEASITATPVSCPVPAGQTTCPVEVEWISDGNPDSTAEVNVYRVTAGQEDGCSSGPECVNISRKANGKVTDFLPVGKTVHYVVRFHTREIARSVAVGAFSSELKVALEILDGVSPCVVQEHQPDCSFLVSWRTSADAAIYRVDEASGKLFPPIAQNTGGIGSVTERVVAGARVYYQLEIGGVPQVRTQTVVGKTDTEGGDANDGNATVPTLPAAFVEPALDADSDQVGAIAGEFRVDEAGASVYRIPLAVPPGAGGLTPSMALVYNSNGADGSLGAGFNLEGVSSIAPCRPSVETGDLSGPTATPSEFCLDGQRLLLVSGNSTHRQVGAEYRTEIESFQRIRITNVASSASDGTSFVFTAEGKDGSVRTFGGAEGTVVGIAETTHSVEGTEGEYAPSIGRRTTAQAWLQTGLKDVAGNVVAFQYSSDTNQGERYLDRVTYSGGSVVFGYAPSTRVEVSYSVLGPRRQAKLVNGIEVKDANGNTLRYYKPTYNTDVQGPSLPPQWTRNRPLMVSLEECSRAGGRCYPATRFEWAFSAGTTQQISGALSVLPGGYYQLGDFDGDKRTDVWWTSSPGGQSNQLLHISTFSSVSSGGQPTIRTIDTGMLFPNGYVNGGLWEVFDSDGDGRDDLLYAFNTLGGVESPTPDQMGWYLRRSNGTSLESPELLFHVPINWAQCRSHAQSLTAELRALGQLDDPNDTRDTIKFLGSSQRADVDGDGLPDLVFRACDGQFWVALMKRTGDAKRPYAFKPLRAVFQDEAGAVLGDGRCGYATANLRRNEENFSQAIDFDGDGRADLRFLIGNKDCLGSGAIVSFRLDVFLSQGEMSVSPDVDGIFLFRAARPFGTSPLIQTEDVAEAGKKLRTIDINGDGLADLLYQTSDNKWHFRLGGPYPELRDTLVDTGAGPAPDAHTLQLLDFDGDGKLDFWEEVKTAGSNKGSYMVRLWKGDNWSDYFVVSTDYERLGNDAMHAIGDFDGDGILDIFSAHADGKVDVRRSNGHHKPRGVMTKITNGLGAITSIDYAPLTFAPVYRRDYDAPFLISGRGSPVFDVAAPSYVVSRVSSSAPTLASQTAQSAVSYHYAGLKVQAGGRGSLGFRRVTSRDEQTGIEVDSYYMQRFPYTGLAELTETRHLPATGGLNVKCGYLTAANPDSPACMMYVPPCPGGIGSTCNDDLAQIGDSSRVIKASEDLWQFRKGSGVGALGPECVPAGTSSARPESANDVDYTPIRCRPGWRSAEPPEVDQLTLQSSGRGPIFVTRIHSLTGNYDLATGMTGDALSTESTDFAIEEFDGYGNPLAGTTTKSGGGTSVSTQSKFSYDNDVVNWKLGRLRTASVATTRSMLDPRSNIQRTSKNVRRSSFTYNSLGMLASEKVEGVSGISLDGPVDTGAPTVAKYYAYDSFGNRITTSVCSTTISESDCRTQVNSGGSGGGFSFHPVLPADLNTASQVMRHSLAGYGASGRHAETTTELFSMGPGSVATQGATARVQARNGGGDPTDVYDFKGINTKIRYGALGRKRFSWSQDGATTRWDANYCGGKADVPIGAVTVACPAGMALAYRATTTRAGAPASMTFHDVLGRPVVGLTQSFEDARWIAVVTQYDAVGNVKRQSEPFFARDAGAYAATPALGSSLVWKESTYDALSRPTKVEHTGTGAVATIAYAGLATTTTQPVNGSGKIQTTIEMRNGLGETVRTIDSNNFEVETFYDAGGNPVEVRRGSLVTAMSYDTLGRKTGMNDPDAGSGWAYKVNGVGEVIRQISPRGTCTTSEYDGRGRVWRRRDYSNAACTTQESSSTWTYDTYGSKGLGEVAQESNGQVVRNFAYDGLGRLNWAETTLDLNKKYTDEWTFDEYGRAFQHFFTPANQPKTGEQSVYKASGHLLRVQSAYPLRGGAFPVYREVVSTNARGQVTKEASAAGASYTQERVFDENTGQVKQLLMYSTAGGVQQDVLYEYDRLGNLMSRQQNDRSLILYEKFDYDALQRLTGSSVLVGGTTVYARSQSYSADGNLTTKNDAGQYVYGTKPAACGSTATPGPHAVSDVGSTWRCYDANGNVVRQLNKSNGQQVLGITYNAADQATDLVHNGNADGGTPRPSARVKFFYGPNRERVRRVDYDGTVAAESVVHTVGGAEIRYSASGDAAGALQHEVRRYVGNVIVVQSGSGVNYRLKRQIVLADRQGSTYQVLGAMSLRPIHAGPMSFDAWGKRRDGDTWSEAVPWTRSLETMLRGSTTHGYTSHEMAESVGVIHMNGRLYDPHFARFLQADPYVQSPGDGQSWNRYSYTFNNPLGYTDPSGNISVGEVIKIGVFAMFTYATGGAAAGLYAAGSTGAALTVSMVGGAAVGAMQTGTLRGALGGAISSGLFFGIGSYYQSAKWAQATDFENAFGSGLRYSGYAAKTLSHGMAGGVMSELQGGRFGHGFASAGFGEALSPAMQGGSMAGRMIASVVVGGTASMLAGGKFANGAVTAAFGFAFNEQLHYSRSADGSMTVRSPGEDIDVSPEALRFAAGFVPGYDILDCLYSSGCGYAGWGLAIAGAVPGGKGLGVAIKGAANTFKDFNLARNAAVKWLGMRGFRAESATIGKFGENAGRPIGMRSVDGKTGFRVEFDARHGAHINVWHGGEKATFTFDGTNSMVNRIVRQFLKE